MVHLVKETGAIAAVSAVHFAELEGRAIGEVQTLPDDKQAILAT